MDEMNQQCLDVDAVFYVEDNALVTYITEHTSSGHVSSW